MTLLLSDADIRAVLRWRPAVDALRAAYALPWTAGSARGPASPWKSYWSKSPLQVVRKFRKFRKQEVRS